MSYLISLICPTCETFAGAKVVDLAHPLFDAMASISSRSPHGHTRVRSIVRSATAVWCLHIVSDQCEKKSYTQALHENKHCEQKIARNHAPYQSRYCFVGWRESGTQYFRNATPRGSSQGISDTLNYTAGAEPRNKEQKVSSKGSVQNGRTLLLSGLLPCTVVSCRPKRRHPSFHLFQTLRCSTERPSSLPATCRTPEVFGHA